MNLNEIKERIASFEDCNNLQEAERIKKDGFKYVMLYDNKLVGTGTCRNTLTYYLDEEALQAVEVITIRKWIKRLEDVSASKKL